MKEATAIKMGVIPFPGFIHRCVLGASEVSEIPSVCQGAYMGIPVMAAMLLGDIMSPKYRIQLVGLKKKEKWFGVLPKLFFYLFFRMLVLISLW